MLHNSKVVGFAEGTPILMSDGTWKSIEQVKQGDWVMSFDPNTENSELEARKVLNTFSALHRDCIEIHAGGKVTIVAKDQLFFAPGANWLTGYDTKQVIQFDGSPQDIQVRRVSGGKFKIYDITVDETHSLVANDLRVHNYRFTFYIKRKVIQAPQPVVTAGRPGRPVSVTTTFNGNTTTVTVNPSPGSAGQISASSNGSISIRQNNIPGLPISDYTVYQPTVVLPYPGGSYVFDRASNADNLRNKLCESILNVSLRDSGSVSSSQRSDWGNQIDRLVSELNSIKSVRVYRTTDRNTTTIRQDSTLVDDAISSAKALKSHVRSSRRLSSGFILQNCTKMSSIIDRIKSGVPDISNPVTVIIQSTPAADTSTSTVNVSPSPSNYHSDRIYDNASNYNYMLNLPNTCSYVFDPPNAPAVTSIKYYKHLDTSSGKYYYDRVSSNAVC